MSAAAPAIIDPADRIRLLHDVARLRLDAAAEDAAVAGAALADLAAREAEGRPGHGGGFRLAEFCDAAAALLDGPQRAWLERQGVDRVAALRAGGLGVSTIRPVSRRGFGPGEPNRFEFVAADDPTGFRAVIMPVLWAPLGGAHGLGGPDVGLLDVLAWDARRPECWWLLRGDAEWLGEAAVAAARGDYRAPGDPAPPPDLRLEATPLDWLRAGARDDAAVRLAPLAGMDVGGVRGVVSKRPDPDTGPWAPLSQVSDNALAEYVARRRGQVSDASTNRETELLRRVLRRADRVWGADVAMPDWPLHLLPEPDERVRALTAHEEAALVAALHDRRPDILPMITFAHLSGLRLSNVIRLTWADIDYGAGVLTVRTKSRRPGGRLQVLPLTSTMVALLEDQRGQHAIYPFTYQCKRSRGRRRKGERYPFSLTGWRKDWTAALAAAGIRDFRFHDLRHTFATRLLRATGNLKLVQKALGHASIATTAKYAHVDVVDVRRGMEALTQNPPQGSAAGRDGVGKKGGIA